MQILNLRLANWFNRTVIHNNQGNMLLPLVVLLMTVMAVSVSVAMQMIQNSHKASSQELYATQAQDVARAGLMDAISWFKRQSGVVSQNNVPQNLDNSPDVSPTGPQTYAYKTPDLAFNPQYDSDPTKSATLDTQGNLINEYPLNNEKTIWAHYEIKRQQNNTAYDSSAVHDITDKRFNNEPTGAGLAWSMVCTGYVYARLTSDQTVLYNQKPNRILASAKASTEILTLHLNIPAAAVVIQNATGITINSNATINGQNAGGVMYGNTTSPNPPNPYPGAITGSPAWSQTSSSITVQNTFGVTLMQLKQLADVYIGNGSPLPASFPAGSLSFINQDVTFDDNHPLAGGGVLFINGNLTITNTAASPYFSGVIYVMGNATITGGVTLNGSLLVNGTLTMGGQGTPNGVGATIAGITYDGSVVGEAGMQLSQYHENKATSYIFSLAQGGIH